MATGGTYLSRKLEQLLPNVKTKRYRQLKFENGSVVPTMADLEAGAAEVVSTTMDEVGTADIVAGDAFDIPIVDISANEDRYKIFMIAAAFSYTFDEERRAEKGNLTITDRKMMVARRSIAERHNRIAAYGDTRVNVTGFLNNSKVGLNNSSFNPNTATADEIAEFFVDEIKAVHTGSNNVEMPTTALVSSGMYFTLVKKRVPDSSMTLLQYIQKALSENDIEFSIRKIEECDSAKLEAAGVQASGTNKDRMVLYPLDPEVVERHIELVQLMPADWQYIKDGRKIYPLFSCTTPTIWNYPGAGRYIDHVKVA